VDRNNNALTNRIRIFLLLDAVFDSMYVKWDGRSAYMYGCMRPCCVCVCVCVCVYVQLLTQCDGTDAFMYG
jgi:hypothetical protein